MSKEASELIYNNCGSDKIFILPEYPCNKKHLSTKKNVYFVKNEISDLKNEDFFIKQELKESNRDKITFYSYGFITPIILFGIYLIIKKLKK